MDFNKKLTLEGLKYYHSKLKTLFSNINKTISDETTRATTKENEIASNLSSHITNTSNPHSVTKSQVGLSNVENKSSATIRGEITKSNVVTALGYTPLNQTLKGSASGLAELDSNGKVPSSQLPSFVDDVVEGYLYNSKFYKESAHTTVITGETGKIYIDLSTNKTYRWSGSSFVVISETLALGETSSTAYRGDRGKIAYDHSQATHAPSNAQANVIETVKVNGTALTPSSKAVNITVPTVGNGTITITQNGTTKGTFTTNQSGNTTIALTDTDTNTTYSDATTSTSGLMSASDKTKLNGIATGANKTTVDSSLSSTSTNPVQNKVINSALNGKAINKTLTNENLNEITTPGFYNAGANNSVTNKPSEIDAFGLEVIHNASGNFYTQILYLPTQSTSYRRYCINGSWESWTQDKLTDTWRGIQDNLTSTSTTDSLSANQGKVLKELVDGKAASSHTHNYAGSSSAGGSATSAVKLTSSAGSTTQPVYFKDGKPTACSYTLEKSVPSNAVFTDTNTHYTSKNVVGSATATSNTTTALTNGNVYLNSVENGVVTSAHKISGSGTTTVTTDTSGNIVISSTSSFSGTVDGTTWNCINVNRTNSAFSGIQFLTQGTPLGGIGTLTANGDFIKVDNTGKQLGAFIDTTNYSTKITSLPNLSGNVITKATKAGEGFRIKDTNNIEVGYFDAHTIGTTETEGETVIMAGNSKAKGTAGNSTGKILLYGDSSTFAVIKPSSGMTSNSAFVLPKTGGTLATTSDVLNARQQLVSTDIKLPLLLAHATNTDTTQNIDSTLYRNNSIYANPSTGSLYANNFYGIASGIQVEEVMSETSSYGGTLKVYCIGRKLMVASINGMWASGNTTLTKTYSGEFNTALDTSYIAGIDTTNESVDSTIRYVKIETGTRDIKIKNFTTSNCHATLVWLIS